MKIAYLDCFSGISGDMLLGAFIDAGADENAIRSALKTLPCASEFEMIVEKVCKQGITGTDVNVIDKHHEHHQSHDDHQHSRNYADIVHIIDDCELPKSVKHNAKRIFRELALAEGMVHGKQIEDVHFHEVGAIDSIVDIIGSAIAIDLLGIERIIASPINVGGGTVKCAHGVFPVPAPATALLLNGMISYGSASSFGELATPTGVAFIKAMGTVLDSMPQLILERCGYGFGKRETGCLNALRLFVGEISDETDEVYVVETNIDDMSPEALAYAVQELRECNALDVYQTSITMKKHRMGVQVSAICKKQDLDIIIGAMLVNTTSLGVRYYKCQRTVLSRRIINVETRFGSIRVKESEIANGRVRHKPEFDDCAAAAKQYGLPFETVYLEVVKAIRE